VRGALEQGFVFYSPASPPEFQLRAGFSFAISLQDRFSKAVHEAWRAADIGFFIPQRDSLFDA
jgi:hypothetical protein